MKRRQFWLAITWLEMVHLRLKNTWPWSPQKTPGDKIAGVGCQSTGWRTSAFLWKTLCFGCHKKRLEVVPDPQFVETSTANQVTGMWWDYESVFLWLTFFFPVASPFFFYTSSLPPTITLTRANFSPCPITPPFPPSVHHLVFARDLKKLFIIHGPVSVNILTMLSL